ncbi:hypothetical protein SAMN05518848_1247 [Paenibacillus sp. PDC88]|nr:hypothetical protein SAMN05518848_1247 [Paenibacillus sp. PDC88]
MKTNACRFHFVKLDRQLKLKYLIAIIGIDLQEVVSLLHPVCDGIVMRKHFRRRLFYISAVFEVHSDRVVEQRVVLLIVFQQRHDVTIPEFRHLLVFRKHV